MARLFRFSNRPQRMFIETACTLLGAAFFLLSGSALPALAFNPDPKDAPKSIVVKGKTVDLTSLKNPYQKGSSKYPEHLEEGAEVYFRNCYLCHGDLLDGKGVFGDRFFPPPANFRHPANGVIYKPQAYAYWRIMKGGAGLPEKLNPWDSAMPAWEDQLTETEVWEVIAFIYETAKEIWVEEPETKTKPSVERGREVYQNHCAACHGATGKGDGVAAPYSSPKPRNLTKGQYKLRTTRYGKIPTDEDIFKIITLGLNGTAMPGWKHLPESDRWSLVAYLKTLAKKFEKFKKRGKKLEIISVPKPPAKITVESIERGKKHFMVNCSGCHGVKGRGDGNKTLKIVDIETDALWPRNLSKSWTFKRGASREDLFLTLRTGLYGSAMPRFSNKLLKDEELWDLIHFVQTLSPGEKPKVTKQISVKKVSGAIPIDPTDDFWKNVAAHLIPLGGQIIKNEKLYFSTTDSLNIKAVHNGDEIAFQIIWDDPDFDPVLQKTDSVKRSPPPPIPDFLIGQVEPEEQREIPAVPQEFPDAVALQFPVPDPAKSGKPYFLNGQDDRPVNLWKWESHPNKVKKLKAQGLDVLELVKDALVESKALYEYGQYRVTLKRKMTSKNAGDTQFKSGNKTVPIGFNVWNGTAGETGTKMTVSSWFDLALD